MQGVDAARLNRPPGGNERLRGHLTAEDAKPLLVKVLSAEDIHLDRLEIEEFDELLQSFGHGADDRLIGMAPLVSHARAIFRTEHFQRLWKYTSVSVVSTVVTQVVLFLTYHVWNVGSAVVCNIIATVVASIPAYYLNRTWTWGKKGRSDIWGEIVPFWTIALVAMVLSTVAVGVAAHNADRIAHGSLERALIVNGANLVTYAILWTLRYLVLNRFLFGTRASPAASPPALLGVSPDGVEPGDSAHFVDLEQSPADPGRLEVAGSPATTGSGGLEQERDLSEIAAKETVDPAH